MEIFHQNSCVIPWETDENVDEKIADKPTNKRTGTGEYITSSAEEII